MLEGKNSKNIFVLMRGSIADLEAAQRVIVGVYTTEHHASAGARMSAFGGNLEKYGVPDMKNSLSSYRLLEVPTDVFRKDVASQSRLVDLNPL